MREFAFELALCAHLEREDRIVSRQLGTACHGSRVMDIVCLSPGQEFDERTAITSQTIPPRAIESEIGPGNAEYWGSAFDCHPDQAREIVDEAVDRGFFERERRGGREYVRQCVRYPDWFDSLLGIENKPDLSTPGGLETQLLTDVQLGLLDYVVVATESYVTGAHEHRIPDPVGIWRFDPESGDRTVIREPSRLPVDAAGVEITERTSWRTDVEIVTSEEIAQQRRRVAERAYGKGWRTYEFPACGRIDPDGDGLPVCPWKDGIVQPVEECGSCCDGYESARPPGIDRETLRVERSAWDDDPSGRQRQQTGLNTFLDAESR